MTKLQCDMARNRVLLALALVVSLSGCASINKPTSVPVAPATNLGSTRGYLSPNALPDSLSLIPAPPALGSAAFALDQQVSRMSLALRCSDRWKLAIKDADLNSPKAVYAFSCALDVPITEQATPHLFKLMQFSASDAGGSTGRAKSYYNRPRPFLMNKEEICTPDDESFLQSNGSYPSGHSAIGWAWALILSEVAPEHANAILARGRAFGQSRVICNVHWQSDVIEGRMMGAATVAVLHSKPKFLADLESTKKELAAARSKGLKPTRDCEEEAKELEQQPPPPP